MPKKSEKIKELEATIEELKSENLVKLAELDNSKKRLEREFQKQKELANERVILNLLEVLDNFERALQSKGDILKGVEMIKSQFSHALALEGVEALPAESFDPEMHQAIEISKGDEDAIIEIRRGYKLKDKVIRPTLVKIIQKED